MVITLGSIKPKLYHLIIKWEFPPEGILKCNTDGACRGNPGVGTYGFCMRNTMGDLVCAEAGFIGYTTNVEVEMRAILEALRYCVTKEIKKIIIESDSLLMVNIIKRIWRVPWELAIWYEELENLLVNIEAKIQHVFIEGNTMADYIANLAFEKQ